jgi:aminoglycoside 3-N-acetyltransferase
MLLASSDILYVRAALRPLARPIKAAGGVLPFLHEHIAFKELIVPHFYGARPWWRQKALTWPRSTNSGSLGKQIALLPEALVSHHPTHAFTGIGARVRDALLDHDDTKSCFEPIGSLAEVHDMSMLLLGCAVESPGFSTVHVAQYRLGHTQRHLIRWLLRWDTMVDGELKSRIAPESPGCSVSFDKFYPYYEADGNFIRGSWQGVPWLFVPSARRALQTELALLSQPGRFVNCKRLTCTTCRLRLY